MSNGIKIPVSVSVSGDGKAEVKQAVDAIKNSFSQLEKAISTNTNNIDKDLDKTNMKMAAMAGAVAGVAGTITNMLIDLAKEGAKFAVKSAMDFEDLQTQFFTLLGSVDKAKARMKDLAEFANTTPFELIEVAKASKILQTLTGGAYASGENLRKLGDAAAVAGVPFNEFAVTVGQMYSKIKAGTGAGEETRRLVELGALSGDAKNKIEKLQAQAKNKEAWDVFLGEIKKTDGAMIRMSETLSGKWSTAIDAMSQAMRDALDQGSFEMMKDAVQGIIDVFSDASKDGSAQSFGKSLVYIGLVINDIIFALKGVWEVGSLVFKSLGTVIGDTMGATIELAESIGGIFDFKGKPASLEQLVKNLWKFNEDAKRVSNSAQKTFHDDMKTIGEDFSDNLIKNWDGYEARAKKAYENLNKESEKSFKKQADFKGSGIENGLGGKDKKKKLGFDFDADYEKTVAQVERKNLENRVKIWEDFLDDVNKVLDNAEASKKKIIEKNAEIQKLIEEQNAINADGSADQLKIIEIERDFKLKAIQDELTAELDKIELTKQASIDNALLTEQLIESQKNLKIESDKEAALTKILYDKKILEQKKLNDKKEEEDRLKGMEGIAQGARLTSQTLSDVYEVMGKKSRAMRLALKSSLIGEAIANTFVGATKALTATPFYPINAGLAALTVASGMASVAKISQQKFASGGFPKGANAQIMVNERGQEAILNASAVKRLGADTINSLNSGGSLVQNSNSNQKIEIIYSPQITTSSQGDFKTMLEGHSRDIAKIVQDASRRGY